MLFQLLLICDNHKEIIPKKLLVPNNFEIVHALSFSSTPETDHVRENCQEV